MAGFPVDRGQGAGAGRGIQMSSNQTDMDASTKVESSLHARGPLVCLPACLPACRLSSTQALAESVQGQMLTDKCQMLNIKAKTQPLAVHELPPGGVCAGMARLAHHPASGFPDGRGQGRTSRSICLTGRGKALGCAWLDAMRLFGTLQNYKHVARTCPHLSRQLGMTPIAHSRVQQHVPSASQNVTHATPRERTTKIFAP